MPSLKMLLYAGGVHILTERVRILTQGVRILTLGVVFFIKSSSYVTFFDNLLSCHNHHSKCMFSPHISVKYVKITLFIRYNYFFHPVGSPDVILTFSPSL